ncbi:protein of unknown function [Taphrina deformans PYCC 5710]|uniref:Uncharacterized protein n=1 Tax=Taphrina deformans (strain PYCC 5710 / ATCC 11124 / CBS 356.35 / IMI 108563 / JCM 9778 / NBRC 8474) TaxID=1097556 RepID=R4X8Q3_TAPDE|nr:protein of unknown function [Taphrina deformans PYCC 5710]|eukprot:CCG82018.1 protein of unknown function [Taphrina deformans PYCC 5710]
MDMTRKFIQMGVTRARRYANWAGGKKYTGKLDEQGKKITVTKGPEDEVKAESARIFGVVLKEVQADEDYLQYAREHKEKYENHFKVEKHEDDDEDVLTPVRKRRSEREIKVKVKDESSSD